MAAAPVVTTPEPAGAGARLFGRDAELAELDRLREAARHGAGSGLVLFGDPGIGKSALLEQAQARASGFRVLSCRGTHSESVLAFAGLHALLCPITDRIEALPGPQARALHGALGLDSPSLADRFLVGVALLTLLSDLAAEQPVLVIADDAQWLDAQSAHCLYFVARRCADESLLMLFTAHADPAGGLADQLPALHVRGLDDDSARMLLRQSNPGISAQRMADVLRLTLGNPLAVRELATAEDSELGPSAPGLIQVGPRLHRSIGARIAALAPAARLLVLTVAAEESGEAWVIRRAAADLALPDTAWDEVLDAELIRMAHGRIIMRHPMIRAVTYEQATASDRIAVHRALAEVLSGADADRWAWHVARATIGPSETVAALLEERAVLAWDRGGPLPAAKTLEQAAMLSPEDEAAGRRLAVAARAAWEGGDVPATREYLAEATARTGTAAVVRASGGLAARIDYVFGDSAQASAGLLRAAELTEPATADELRYLATRAAWESGEPGLEELLLDLPPALETAAWRVPSSTIALAMGRAVSVAEAQRRVVSVLRGRGDVGWLSSILAHSSVVEFARGQWDDATADASEALRLSQDMGDIPASSGISLTTLAWLAAARGDEDAAAALGARSLGYGQARNSRIQIAHVHWQLGFNALSAGKADAALGFLSALIDPEQSVRHPAVAALSAADAVEAAVRAGRVEAARAHLAVLSRWAARTAAPWALASVAVSRALLAEGPEAETLFLDALAVPDAPDRPFPHARVQLLYGEWLRRARRRADARVQLNAARETFLRLGATPWEQRADGELALAGDRRREAVGPSGDELLTAQELRIARLAADGLTNREIAAQLFISPRTVGHHLSQIFPKLGLASREDLAAIDFEHGMRLTW
ncbi:AAA family ATPase [Nocardia sp. 2]|uniref:AAA family ATPase n=1 Tax=Nocardia acididurans TaxID=2802282 RepID=A0ABS1MI29_9NOCA|nr:LuxR family transcriptional regulator [Nocardia acididurans]MBL1079939.1 AAA family ATPase [Nocardia acididurans]